jgi:SagB-type dehydrogenase family enzyme
VREFDRRPLALADMAQLLWAAQGVTGPERERTAPSAGALYPLEVFLVAGKGGEPPAGIYRYRAHGHDVALLSQGDQRARLAGAALAQDWLAAAPVTIVVAAVFERTASRYRRRAERYVLMEVGHAAQNIHLQAVALGLGTVVVGAFDDAEVKRVLGLAGHEQPLCLMPVGQPRG